MRDNLYHCVVEFVITDDIVIVAIDLCHDLVPDQFVAFLKRRLAESTVKDFSQLILTYNAITVLVEEVKGNAEVFSAE